MTKRPRTLTAAFVRTISRPGVYGDGRGGRGLSLRVHRTATGRITKTWRQRVRIEGRLTSIGLGPYPEITLAEARQKALDNSRAVRHGGDPRGRGVPTFAEAAKRTIELHRDGWKAGSPLPEQWDAYSDDADHQFRQADHRFRSMPITLEERRSIAALGGRVFGVEV